MVNRRSPKGLREFVRVQWPGGRIVVEIPFRHRIEEIFQHYDRKGSPLETPRFYERYHDNTAVRDRLRAPACTAIKQRWSLGEWLSMDTWITTPRLPRLLQILILPLEPALAMVNYCMRKDDSAGRPLAALVVYERSL